MDALISEIDRIAGVTTWAGNSVMAGTGSANSTKTFSLQVGAATGTKNQVDVAIGAMDTATLDVSVTASAVAGTSDGTNATGTGATITVAANGTATYKNDAVATVITAAVNGAGAGGKAAVVADFVKQINEHADYIAKGVHAEDDGNGTTFSIKVGTSHGHLFSTAAALDVVKNVDAAMLTVGTQRSELGAISNRLTHTVSNMTNVSTNLSAARGGIEDADFALETTNLAKNQILQQAATAMLAQANASKQNVLSLLQ
jgi:flagellin